MLGEDASGKTTIENDRTESPKMYPQKQLFKMSVPKC